MKLEPNHHLIIQFGKPHKKQIWALDLDFVCEDVGENHFGMSKSDVKRLIKQGGIQIGITNKPRL